MSNTGPDKAARRVEAGNLELGGGLEALLSAAFEGTAPGHAIDVETPSKAVALEIPAWARASGHAADREWKEESEDGVRFVVRLKRGNSTRVLAPALAPRGEGLHLRSGGDLHTGDLLRAFNGAIPAVADPTYGLVPVGAVTEVGAPSFDWRLNDHDDMWAEEISDLTERATELQWDATTDIDWEAAAGLPADVERAVAQVMTFIAQNEYAALYVPAKFLPQVNPAFADILMWLASHINDEARHIEVFTKRALVGGDRGYALASTQLSLHTLLEEDDFSSAALLLNVLGEGTFLDLLNFIDVNAPDQATAMSARLAHRDEQRHVHFGISHVRRTIRLDPDAAAELQAAAEARAAKLISLSGMSPILMESLTILAAGSMNPKNLSVGAAKVAVLTKQMEVNRIRRLKAAGFNEKTAQHLSDLHTPNLM
ncbi:MAG: ferritin-like domain-containing protein [Actinomycetota bacterium]